MDLAVHLDPTEATDILVHADRLEAQDIQAYQASLVLMVELAQVVELVLLDQEDIQEPWVPRVQQEQRGHMVLREM